ncbi:MAG: hypothetical protein WDN27_05060 [Candidatus Saccharibacteria bacterium]
MADVLIPTYNEALDILEPVVIGATKIRGVNKVLVLDDGNRPEVRGYGPNGWAWNTMPGPTTAMPKRAT